MTINEKYKRNGSIIVKNNQPYHLVDSNECPFWFSWAVFSFIIGLLMRFGEYSIICSGHYDNILALVAVLAQWIIALIVESIQAGSHGYKVNLGVRLGMVLFIVSEIMFVYIYI
jgi:hypothetical protein